MISLALRPGDYFIDGGANVGLFTLIAADRVGNCGVVAACEPVTRTAAILKNNVSLNGYYWVEVHDVALSDRAGTASLTAFGGDDSGLSSFAPAESNGSEMTVPTITLNQLAERRTPSLVKLDLEGAEVKALRGASEVLASGCPFLVEVEPAHLARQSTSCEDLFEIFESAGYGWRRVADGPNFWFSRPSGVRGAGAVDKPGVSTN